MAAARSIQGLKHVKPILSTTQGDAKLRVLNLYRAWYRTMPLMCQEFDINYNVEECRAKVRETFEMHKNETDLRVIDMLCIKGMQELDEIKNVWKQNCHVNAMFKETWNKKPETFIGRFIDGHQPEPPK